jgi:hypothetical protein
VFNLPAGQEVPGSTGQARPTPSDAVFPGRSAAL